MIIVDPHTHYHKIFDIDDVLNIASRNLTKAMQEIGTIEGFAAVLFVAGIGSEKLNFDIEVASPKEWILSPTGEPNSLVARAAYNRKIYLILGNQVISKEGLEILGFLPKHQAMGRLAIKQIVENIQSSDGLAIVPWGFGKWTGHRKVVMMSLIDTWDNSFCIGDNGGRSKILPHPDIFRLAKKKGIRILPGSDPLPIADESKRIGTCGFCIKGELDENAPLGQIVGKLENPRVTIEPFASYIKPVDFMVKQIQLRLLWLKAHKTIP
jgi:hypothetical protein